MRWSAWSRSLERFQFAGVDEYVMIECEEDCDVILVSRVAVDWGLVAGVARRLSRR